MLEIYNVITHGLNDQRTHSLAGKATCKKKKKDLLKKVDVGAIIEVGTGWYGNIKRDRFFFFPWEQQDPALEWGDLRESKTSSWAEVGRIVTAVKCGRLHGTLLAITKCPIPPALSS